MEKKFIHKIKFYRSNWEVFTNAGYLHYSFEPSCFENEDEAFEAWVEWCHENNIDDKSIEQFKTDVKIRTSNCAYGND